MSEKEMTVEFARMKRRLSELEAAQGLRGLLPPNEDAQVFAAVCREAGLGVRTAQEAGKSDDTVRKRRVVAGILRKKHGWIVKRIARAMNKTERAVEKML